MKAWLASLSSTQRGWLAAAIVPFSPVLIPLFIAALIVVGTVMVIWAVICEVIGELASDKPPWTHNGKRAP